MAERAAAEQAAIADAAALRAAEAAAILGTAQDVTEVGVDDADSGDA